MSTWQMVQQQRAALSINSICPGLRICILEGFAVEFCNAWTSSLRIVKDIASCTVPEFRQVVARMVSHSVALYPECLAAELRFQT